MATPTPDLLAAKIRTVEARLARVEDRLEIVDKKTGLGLSLRERQVLFALVVVGILGLVSLRIRKVQNV
jgi:hypothetical protein